MKKCKEIIFVVNESEEGGYEAKALDCPIYTEGKTMEELKEMIRDAVKCHFGDNNLPQIINLHIVKDEVLTL